MVFTRGKVDKNQCSLKNNSRGLIPGEENYTIGRVGNLGSMPKCNADQESILNLQEILMFLADISPFAIAIFCLENYEILFKNQLLEQVFGVDVCQKYDILGAIIDENPSLYSWLNSSLKSGDAINNLAVKIKTVGKTVAAQISAKAVNYQGKLAALFVFTDINQPLAVQQTHEEAIATPATPKNVNSTCEIIYEQYNARLSLMQRAVAASSNGIVLTDATKPDNPIIYVNPAFESITGYSRDEVMGRNCRFLQGKDTDQQALYELRKALQKRTEVHVILKNYRKNGISFWNELYIAPVFDDCGRLTHFIGIQNDITQHMQAVEALREREEQYRRIVETATEGIWLLNQDHQTTFVNQQMAAMLGYTVEEMLGKTLFAFIDTEGVEIVKTYLEYPGQGINEPHDVKFRCQDGSELWAIISCSSLFDEQGNYTGALGMVTNISDVYDELRLRKRAEEALQDSKKRLDDLLNSLDDIVWSITADTFETLYINPAVDQMYGRSPSEFMENSNLWFEIIHPEDQPFVSQAIQPLLSTGSQDLKYRIIRPDGEVRWVRTRSHVIYDASGKPIRIEGITTDISEQQVALRERKFMEAKLVRHAFYDHLTGLPNRVSFMHTLEQAIAQIQEHPDRIFAVLFLDLDRFKVVNDSLGHIVGDQLLVSFAERLQTCLRPEDTIARLGGDEFTILLTYIQSIDEATRIAENIHQVLKSPFNLNGYEVFTTTSIGIALSTTGYTQPADWLRDADTALYRAKEQGKAWHMVFDTTMYNRVVALLQLETDLRWAIERQELRVVYQPIVSVTTGKITGFEALVRWQHPQRGLISPAEFIPVAEETGLIIPIGEFVLRESCQQLRQWQLEFPDIPSLTMNVNLSGKQFSQTSLVEQIVQILREVDLEPHSLKLEITESALMENPEKAATILQQFKALGIKLCIDDFGTGYSSLAYLHQFPLDVLKIDRSFINRIDRDGERLAIVRAIVTLAYNLGMSVVAEGVETVSQLVQLRLLKCDEAQGYLFSQPLNSENISLLMAGKRGFYQDAEL